VIELNSGWKLDFIIRKSRPFSREEFERRREADILSKLEWAKMSSSERQLNDVAGILRTQGDDLDLEYVERWIAALGLQNHCFPKPDFVSSVPASPRSAQTRPGSLGWSTLAQMRGQSRVQTGIGG